MMNNDYALELNGIRKSFLGRRVLKEVDLAVPTGSVFAFLGNNGEGKSTTIKILTGLAAPDQGSVVICGKKLFRPKNHFAKRSQQAPDYKVLKNLGALIESPSIYPNLTAREFLSIGCKIKRLPKSEIAHVLDIVSLTEGEKDLISHFSLGMKQRLAIAHALLGSPTLLILDEPTNGLDPHGIRDIRRLLSDLPDMTNTTVFFSSHNLDEVEKMASDFAVLKDGKIQICTDMPSWKKSQQVNMVLEVSTANRAWELLLAHGFNCSVVNERCLNVNNIRHQQQANLHALLIRSGFELYQSYYQKLTLEQWFANENSL
ncbi:ATP-binding cassette domain-containing protein [Alteromonas sp. BMJM2]|uniref:ATP-binding cassette domain-containing protein n=1 Tax=Alteromonas sp. BMJM2 TaxID=2954241 RepID=UPI0022B2E1F9|nr:ATP-binding cassette domain-containing protein [Alteromonas sp. BMJM2]